MTDDTHTDDDEPAVGIDLTTWEPPPMMEPNLADDVIARMQRSVPTTRPRNRRAWIAGGLLAAASIGGLVSFALTRRGSSPSPTIAGQPAGGDRTSGDMTARVYRDFPGASYTQKVELGGTTAMLEVNAGFRAAREGSDLYIVDARGEVMWQLAPTDRLHVTLAPDVGFDADPGSTLVSRIHTSADKPIHVEVVGGEIAHVRAHDGRAVQALAGLAGTLVIEPPGDWKLVDMNTAVVDPFASCDDHRRAAAKAADHGWNAAAELAEREAAYGCDHRASDLEDLIVAACRSHDEATAKKYYGLGDAAALQDVVTTCRRWNVELLDAQPMHTGCLAEDIAVYMAKGNSDLSEGQDAAALHGFERAYLCKSAAPGLMPRLVLAACKSGDAAKAKQYYAECNGACGSLVARCETNPNRAQIEDPHRRDPPRLDRRVRGSAAAAEVHRRADRGLQGEGSRRGVDRARCLGAVPLREGVPLQTRRGTDPADRPHRVQVEQRQEGAALLPQVRRPLLRARGAVQDLRHHLEVNA